jgi:hypothetical protein
VIACSATHEATIGPNLPSRTLPTTMTSLLFSLTRPTVSRVGTGSQTERRLAPAGPLSTADKHPLPVVRSAA